MSTILMKRGDNVEMLNTPRIDGLIYFNSDDKCIYLDDGDTSHERVIYGGKAPLIDTISNEDGASNTNTYSALAIKNGTCLKSNVADSANNINNTNTNGRPVGCVGFKSIIGTEDISNLNNTVKGAISTLGNRLEINDNQFVFDYQGGKWGFNTSEERGADTFHPFNSTSLKITDNADIVCTNIQLNVNSTVDTSTTALPVVLKNCQTAVTICNIGIRYSGNDKYMTGGIIHIMDDGLGDNSEGTHNHYIYMDGAWRTATNKTPANGITVTYQNYAIKYFVIPTIKSHVVPATGETEYVRSDVLYCMLSNNDKINIYRYDYTTYYDQGVWTLLNSQTVTSYRRYGIHHDSYVVYNGEFYALGGRYDTYQYDNNMYIWSPITNEWRTESLGLIKSQTTEDYYQGVSFLEATYLVVHNNQIYAFNFAQHWDDNYPNNLIYATYNGEEWSYTSESWGNEKIPQYIYNGFNLNNFSANSLFEYNGEIHSFTSNLHSVLNDSYLNTDNANVVTAYPNLKYTLNQSMICVAPQVYVNATPPFDYYSTYENAKYLQAPTYIHYMGGVNQKVHYQMQNTYIGAIANSDNKQFVNQN